MDTLVFKDSSTVNLYRAAAADVDVARAAWVSHSSDAHIKEADPNRVEGLINFLLRNNHTSPFEHGQFTFIIRTPIFVAREFMRHRTFSYNEVSGRYSELEPVFYIPGEHRPVIQQGKIGHYSFMEDGVSLAETQKVLKASNRQAWVDYRNLLSQGVAREVARDVLPVNLMTTFWATVNPLNLMRFLDLRTDEQALYEIRHVALRMEKHFEEAMPLTWRAWKTLKQ